MRLSMFFEIFPSGNLTNHGITQAASLDDVYVRSTMTSDSSLYGSVPRSYYDDTVRYFCRVLFLYMGSI